jgi:trehalose 6-phosphate phosphatase
VPHPSRETTKSRRTLAPRASNGGSGAISWWNDVAPRLRDAPQCALFLDFDGTLADFTDEPQRARLSAATRRVLRVLAQQPRARLFFISGRRRDDLWKRVRLPGCQYLGLFGAECTGRPGPARSAAVERLRTEITAAIAGLPGVWIEEKGVAFVVHHRGAAPRVRALARRRVGRLLRAGPSVRHFDSAHGIEIVPREITGKGEAVRRLLRAKDLRRAIPIYLGDDVSDESGFRAARHGLTIKVGRARDTAARYRLADPGEVRELLGLIAQALQ